MVSDDQPEAREGQAGRFGVAERFVVPRKPGNAGGGKGPQFKTNALPHTTAIFRQVNKDGTPRDSNELERLTPWLGM